MGQRFERSAPSRGRRRMLLGALAVAALLIAACGDDDDADTGREPRPARHDGRRDDGRRHDAGRRHRRTDAPDTG